MPMPWWRRAWGYLRSLYKTRGVCLACGAPLVDEGVGGCCDEQCRADYVLGV